VENTLWTFVSSVGRDLLVEWAENSRLPTKVRAQLDQKLDVLRQHSFDSVAHSKLLAGPVAPHVYKLRVNGTIAVRILLCRGPVTVEIEYTLLQGAIEKDGRLDPRDAATRACSHRAEVLRAPALHRKDHVCFSPTAH